MNVTLIGYRGCGKSAVGRALADRLGWTFVDTDVLIERREGLTIRAIFSDRAEQGFRHLEAQVVAHVAAMDCQVISTGGGVVLRPENTAALRANSIMVWLTAPPEILWQRIVGDLERLNTRPDLDLTAGLQEVHRALKRRLPLYEQAADVTIETTNQSVQSVVEQVLGHVHLKAAIRHEEVKP